MRYRCPFCYYTITIDDMSRGYPAECAGCGKTVQIPPGKFDPGCMIGDFVILEKIGAGSIGAVYKATQLSLDRQVALKILLPEYSNSNGIEDFLREARAAAKLSHTNLVQSLAVGEEDGICYMAMTYVNGENLKSRLRREGRIPVDEALHITQQVAEALYYAWDEAGLIHRDVKPDNIMTTDDGIIKLTDLGLAMKQTEWTEDMEISGSPSYMSPEQFAGAKLDPRSDIYSLGITLYQMISGRLPFDGTTVKKIARQHMEEEPVALRRLIPGIPIPVDALVKKMMAKRQEDRYNGMEDVLKAIWTIRQKTAPNKSLVPDVHTISIKRLDYEIQNESSELKEKAARYYPPRDLFKERFLTVLSTALTVSVLLVILWAIFGTGHTNESLILFERVAYFEKLCADKSLDRNAILEEGKKILDELPDGKSPVQKYNRLQMRRLLTGLELDNVRSENQILIQEKRNLERSAKNDIAKLQEFMKKMEELQRELSYKNDYEVLKRKAEQLDGKIWETDELKKKLNSSQKQTNHLSMNYRKIRMEKLRMEILQMQRNRKYRETELMIAAEQGRQPDLYSWLAGKDEFNALLLKIYEMVTDSEKRFSGFPIGEYGNIEIISGGYIDYKNPYGELKQKIWYEFPASALCKFLLMDTSLRENSVAVRSACEFLLGNYGAACKANPKNVELQKTVDEYAERSIQQIKYGFAVDKLQTESKVKELLELLRGSGNYAKYEKELKQLL